MTILNDSSTNSFVYGIIDPRDGFLKYVGKTIHGKTRFREHLSTGRLTGTTKKKCWLKKLLKLGFSPQFLILEEAAPADLPELEVFYISYLRSIGSPLLNMTTGGEGTPGRKLSQKNKDNLRKRMTGRYVSPATREKIGNAGRLRIPTEATISKLRNRKINKPVIDLVTGEIFPSLMEVSRQYGLSSGALCDVLNEKTITIHGKFLSYLPGDVADVNIFRESELKRKQEFKISQDSKRFQFKPVICLDTGTRYESVNAAATAFGVKNNTITAAIKSGGKVRKHRLVYG